MDNLVGILSKSKRIAITGHLGPDSDSIVSVLFLFNVIKKNFPDKFVIPVVKGGVIAGLTSLQGVDNVDVRSVEEVVSDLNIDTLFILDASKLFRITDDVEALKKIIAENSTSVVCFDHHQDESVDSSYDLHMIVNSSSTVEILFDLFINKLKYKIYEEGYDVVALGMVTDTQSFAYKPEYDYHKSLEIYSQLLDNGAGVAKLLRNLTIFTDQEFHVMASFLSNYHVSDKYNYMYLDLDSVNSFGLSRNDLKRIINYLSNTYLRATKNSLGFLVSPNVEVPGNYRISFRAYEEYYDVSVFAKKLGGGGHVGSAGGEISAESIDDAIDKIKGVMETYMEQAKRS